MAEIGFYHLLTTPLERALPRLLERACAQGHRVVIRAASPERVEHLNALLWTYDDASFLPHGAARDGNPAAHPIWLSDHAENPNGASILFLVDGVEGRVQAKIVPPLLAVGLVSFKVVNRGGYRFPFLLAGANCVDLMKGHVFRASGGEQPDRNRN